MENLKDKIPIELTKTLINFNIELLKFGAKIDCTASTEDIHRNNSKFEKISISYKLKNSSHFFNIFFVREADKICWKYYPHNDTSTRATSISEIDSDGNGTYTKLMQSLLKWKDVITQVRKLENPLDYFNLDRFIKFYSDEILTEIPISDNQLNFPLSSKKQKEAKKLIIKQKEFLNEILENIKDKNSEEYSDLNLSKSLIEEVEKELPRLTEAEVKRNWSISLAAIKKWCEDKFIAFLISDKNIDYNLSRSLGSFIGGLFGFPNIGG